MYMHRKRYLKAAVLVGHNFMYTLPHIQVQYLYTHTHLYTYIPICTQPTYLAYFYLNLSAIFMFNFLTYAHPTLLIITIYFSIKAAYISSVPIKKRKGVLNVGGVIQSIFAFGL